MTRRTKRSLRIALPSRQVDLGRASVSVGQRYLLRATSVPWKQTEDLVVRVVEVYRLTPDQLQRMDVVSAAAAKHDDYAVLEHDDGGGVQLPCDLLLELGVLL
jgi:hypothetical protein